MGKELCSTYGQHYDLIMTLSAPKKILLACYFGTDLPQKALWPWNTSNNVFTTLKSSTDY